MIPRVLEPEAMDTAEDAAEYDAMDHSGVNVRFVADFLASHGPCRGGTILDVGTGTARIPLELCRVDPNAMVRAVDLAEHMLALGRKNVQEAGLTDRIRLEKVDAKGFPYPDRSFEAVISNSIVHHIPEPAAALAEMVRLVAPGGTLFCRDLARPESSEHLEQLVTMYAGRESASARDLLAASLHAALTLNEVRAIVSAMGFSADDVALTSDRHWTWISRFIE
ncbi:MAG: rebM 1 [Planctomycetota bacterium]|nr:rebM 1 [Planctomycetota bacterium]